MPNDFGSITITNELTDEGAHHVRVEFGALTVIEVFGLLEMARLQVIAQALGLEDDE